ncbi:PAS domain S-box protein [Magnetovirga frankeli]|uniref:chemotaxis protein CheB n=1 Tax=Magnetovirga frankeli TaxID=947516 RepID=UPI0012930DB6|nr:PAS domain S-box protein [gamma proteobacterium SS-5]
MTPKTPSDLKDTPSHYVGIGASAGGLEAIDTFFKNMPPDSGCAFIVVQHLSPDHKSLMVELLGKRTEMPLSRAEEGMLVRPNHVYLIPPNHDLRIFHGKLLLNEQDRHGGINLPIDIFLNSLAEDQGDKAVAIILSGTGSDGTRGVRAIKEKVGMVMVQNEDTAAFDGMPRSAIATGLVDYILAPEEMPQQLVSYIKHPYANKAEGSEVLLSDEDSTNGIFALLREKSGVDFTYYKPSTMVRRIERRMSVNQILDLRDYLRYLERYPGEVDTLYRDLLIGVTNFFRDPLVFQQLNDKWLPELIEGAESNSLRMWVAGCSTGEEAYSLAMACHEVMSRLGKLLEIKIFATDVDRDAIATAGIGIYPESISADVPPEFLAKYFHRREKDYLIARHIREMVVFAQHNVIKDPPFTNISLVSCRNLLIYLQPVLQQRVIELFNFSLRPGGILLLGSSETTGEMAEYFEPLHHKWKLYRSRGRKRRDVLSDQAAHFDVGARLSRPASMIMGQAYRHNLHEEERLLDRLLQSLGERYLPFTLVINEGMELLYMAGDARSYLRFPSGKMITDLSRLVHKDLAIPLATGVQKVLKKQQEAHYSNIHLRDEDNSRTVNMRIGLLPKTKAQDVLLAVFIEEVVSSGQPAAQGLPLRGTPVLTYDVGKEAEQRINDLEQELQFTRENLQATVEELETSNEELQATNEELLASNEELQSTNEELQSVNEELYTVNAEHQSKIAELTEVNNDLDNLLDNIRVATLFLDQNLEIRRFTPEIAHFMRIIEQDIGRPFDHLTHDLADVDLDGLVRGVNQKHESVEQEVSDRGGNAYLMRIFPYRIGPEFYSGVLLTFVSINATRQMREALQRSEERYKLAQESAGLGSWEWNIGNNQLTWSPQVEAMFGLEPGQFTGGYEAFLALLPQDDRQRLEREVKRSLDDPSRPYTVRHRAIWPDGQVRWLEENGRVHLDPQGLPERMLGMVKDITENHQTEDALIRSQDLFRSTLENLDLVAVQLDRNGHISFVNDYFLEQLGWQRKDLMGQSWFERCIPEDQRAEVRRVFEGFIGGDAPMLRNYQNPILQGDGGRLQVYWSNTPIYDNSRRPTGVCSIGMPVVDHRGMA